MDEERFRDLLLDLGNVQEIVRAPHCPALVSTGSRYLTHYDPQEVAAVSDRTQHSVPNIASVQTGTPELPAAQPVAHQLSTGGDLAKIPESGKEQIENERL